MPLSIVHLILCTAFPTVAHLPFLSNVTLVPESNSTSVTLTQRVTEKLESTSPPVFEHVSVVVYR